MVRCRPAGAWFCTDECRRKGQKAERIIEDDSYADGVQETGPRPGQAGRR